MVRDDTGSILGSEVNDLIETRTRDELLLVGEGRTAEIVAWDEGRVVRLFREGSSRRYALREQRVSRAVHSAGVPSPEVFLADTEDGLVEVDGRLGILMERVEGPTMLRELARRPWKLWAYANECARLHREMHARTAVDLPSQRERLHHVIDRIAEALGDDIAERIHQAVDKLPEGDAICHGDFHPDNVMMSERGAVIIDWGPSTSGNPAADVAWTVHLIRHGGTPPGMRLWQRLMLTVFRRLFLGAYLKAYLRHSPLTCGEIESWEGPIAALRLGDRISEKRELLLKDIRKHYGPEVGDEA